MYIKYDTPRLNTSNVLILFLSGNSLYQYLSPAISTHTDIVSATIDGISDYVMTKTGILVKPVIDGKDVSFECTFNDIEDLDKTMSDDLTIEVTTQGDAEYTGTSESFKIGIIFCKHVSDFYNIGTTNLYVSNYDNNIDTNYFTPVDDIHYDTSSSSSENVAFTAVGNSFVGIPSTPNAYVGVCSGTVDPVPGVSIQTTRPVNIAVKDTRIYTDQEYVIVVDDPSLAIANRSNIKIHDVSDPDGSVPFHENPGNGFYLNMINGGGYKWAAQYVDMNNDEHIYELSKVWDGEDDGKSNLDCEYLSDGACTYHGGGCKYKYGIRGITDSRWELAHNGSIVSDASSTYNSSVPPSSGWSGAVITGEPEIQYMGKGYAYSSEYYSVSYIPDNDGQCVELPSHLIHYFIVKEDYSKSFPNWGVYGATVNNTSDVNIISYDTVTGVYAKGVKTINITEEDPDALTDVLPITGPGLLVSPITHQYMDQVIAVGGVGAGAGLGTSSGPYGVALSDTPEYDWAQVYNDRPRTANMLPYGDADTEQLTQHTLSTKTDSVVVEKILVCGFDSKKVNAQHGGDGILSLVNEFPNVNRNWRNSHGVKTHEFSKEEVDITASAEYSDLSNSLPYYKCNYDIPELFTGVSTPNLSYNLSFKTWHKQEEYKSENGKLTFCKYILYDDIIYYHDGRDIILGCMIHGNSNTDYGYEELQGEPELRYYPYDNSTDLVIVKPRLYKNKTYTTFSAYAPEYLSGILIESIDNSNGKSKKRSEMLSDMFECEDGADSVTIKGALNNLKPLALKSVYDTYKSAKIKVTIPIISRPVLREYRSGTIYKRDHVFVDSIGEPIYELILSKDESYTINENDIEVLEDSELVRKYSIKATQYLEKRTTTSGNLHKDDIFAESKPTILYTCGASSDGVMCVECDSGYNYNFDIDCSEELIIDHITGINLGFSSEVFYTGSGISAHGSYSSHSDCYGDNYEIKEHEAMNDCSFNKFESNVANIGAEISTGRHAAHYLIANTNDQRSSEYGTYTPELTIHGKYCPPTLNIMAYGMNILGVYSCSSPIGSQTTMVHIDRGLQNTRDEAASIYCEITEELQLYLCLTQFGGSADIGGYTFIDKAEGVSRYFGNHISDTVESDIRNELFTFEPGSRLSLYFPSTGSRKRHERIDRLAKVDPGRALDGTVQTTQYLDIEVTLTNTSDPDDSGSDDSTQGTKKTNIFCYESIDGGYSLTRTINAIYTDINDENTLSTSTQDTTGVFCIYPFEAPNIDDKVYRDIYSSSKIQLHGGINPNEHNVEVNFNEELSSTNYICDSYSNDLNSSMNVERDDYISYDNGADGDITLVQNKPVKIDMENVIKGNDIIIDISGHKDPYSTDSDLALLIYDGSSTCDIKILWSSRPKFNIDYQYPANEITLPEIPETDNSIYVSHYRREGRIQPTISTISHTESKWDSAEQLYDAYTEWRDQAEKYIKSSGVDSGGGDDCYNPVLTRPRATCILINRSKISNNSQDIEYSICSFIEQGLTQGDLGLSVTGLGPGIYQMPDNDTIRIDRLPTAVIKRVK